MDEVTLVKTRYRKEQWKQLILDCQSSGLKVGDWCKQVGVTHHAYYYWLRKIREESCTLLPDLKKKPEKQIAFKKLEVQTALPDTQAAVVIHLPSASLEIQNGAEQQTVEAVLLALKNIC